MKKVSIKKSKIHGNGLFAEEQIKRGDTIGVAHQVLNTSNHKLFVPTGIVGKNYNHSKNNPNAENIMDGNKRYLVALTDIKPGTEITSNYYNTPDMEQPKKEWEDKLADGGESTNCPEGYYYDPVQGCIPNDEHQKWLRDWYTNRKMSTPEGQEILKKVQPEVLKRAENFPPYLMTEELPENTPASYDLEKNAVMLNKFLPEKMLEESKTHEGAHYLTSGDKFLNLFDKQIGYVVNNNVIDDPKKINTGNEKWDKELRKNFDYAVSPEEMYAKIMTLRRDAGFDPAKSITLQDLEDYFTKVKDSGSSLNPDIEELKAVTKDKQAIVNLLNDLVSIEPTTDIFTAQNGGQIPWNPDYPQPTNYEFPIVESSNTTCDENGQCYETDQIQELYNRGMDIPKRNVGLMWDVADDVSNPKSKYWANAKGKWKSMGLPQTLGERLNMKDPYNCMWAAGSGWQCLDDTREEFKKLPLSAFESNDKFINAVNKGKVPFERVVKTSDRNFDSQKKNILKPGDIINIKGPNNISHAMTFSHYREDGIPIYLDSNGNPMDFGATEGIWSELKPGNGTVAYVSRFSPDKFYEDKIKTLEEKARTNPTYYKLKGGSIKKFNPGGIVNDLPQNVGVSYLQNEDRSYYDPISDTVNLNPNATDAELNHELVHAWQNRTGRLRTNPNLPQQRPPIVASDEQAASYYTRKGDDVDYYLNNLTTLVPEFGGHTWNEDLNRFIPEELKYNKVIDPIMYSDPNTMEGEAEFLSQTKGRPSGIGFRQSGGSSNDAFQKKLEEVAKRLKVSKADLLGIMKHESGLNPHAVNPYTGATGLIQFMPTTAKRLGTSVQELRNMSAIEQLNYVEKFYRPVAGRAKDIGDLYMFTFLPAVVGKPNDYVIGAKGSGKSIYGLSQDALYRQNAGFDKDKKGYYTVGDVKARIAKYSTSKGKLKEDTPSRKVESKTPGIKMETTPLDKDIPIEEYSEIKYNPVEKVEQPVRPKYTLEQAMFEMGAVETPTSTPQMSAVLKFLSPKRFNPGQVQASLTDNEIQQYIKGGYVVEEVTPKMNNGGEATPSKIWVKSKDDPRYKDYLTRQALYNYSNTPNFNLRDAAVYDLYDSIKDNNFDEFTNDYYSNLLKTIEKEKEENKDTGEWFNTYYKQILEDPYYGAYGSKVNYETLINPNMVNQPDFSSSLLNQPEIMPFFTQYPPREWEKKTEYNSYPFNNYYDTNANASYGSKNYWQKPDTLLIEDEINRSNLKNIYPNLSEEDIQKEYQEMITEPGYISNEYNSQWNYYPYVTTENYSTGEYLADPKQLTFTDSDGRKGYLPESIQDNIYNTFEYTPRWDKPEQAYGIIPDPIIINPPKLENPSNLTLRPSTELPEPIEAPQYTLDPYTADRLSLDIDLPQNKIKKLFDSGVLANKGHIDLGVKNKTRLIPRIVQKVTGYDPAYFEGYEDEEGKYVPGELDYGNEVGGKMEFRGAASLQDLINQQKYAKDWEEYERKIDEREEQSKKKQEQGKAFKKGGQYKLGEVVDELTKKKLEKLGYTFEIVK